MHIRRSVCQEMQLAKVKSYTQKMANTASVCIILETVCCALLCCAVCKSRTLAKNDVTSIQPTSLDSCDEELAVNREAGVGE